MYESTKRVFDLLASTAALIVLLPFGLPLMIALRLSGEGDVFYRQKRLGYGNEPFTVLKFATMLRDSENMAGGKITLKNDSRLTPLGGFLRKSKINELPQLWNVFIGEMSVIGPRPLPPESHEWYSAEVRSVLAQSKPGLSGIASLVFRDEESVVSSSDRTPIETYRDLIFPYKGKLELWYSQHKSLKTDATIIALTVWSILSPGDETVFRLFDDLPERPEEIKTKTPV